MSSGKRYEGEHRLNIKKVIATILVILVIVMAIILMVDYFKKDKGLSKSKNITNSYQLVFTGDKWGVINSSGNYVINPIYKEMITIPDATKPIFIYQTNVDYEKGTYKSKAINEKSETIFTSYDSVEALQNIDESGVVFYDTNALKVSKAGKYGLINFDGKQILAPEYNSISTINHIKNCYITEKNNLKGLVDNTGNVIIDNLYADIKPLTNKYEDGFVVKNDSSQYGLIDYNKKKIFDCKYSEIYSVYGNNIYVVKDGDKTNVINKDGTVLFELKDFSSVVSINGTDLVAKKDNKYGVLSSDGTVLLKAEYDKLQYLYNEKFIAQKDNKFGIINVAGEIIVPFNYSNITYMSEESFIEADREDGKTDLMDSDFKVKCTGIVSEINSTYSFIKVRVDGNYKYYKFNLQEETQQEAYPANNLFLSKEGGKYGFVDKNGIVVVDYKYEDATEQNKFGYSAVKLNGKWGAIDAEGKIVVEPTLSLTNNLVYSFLGKYHLAPDLNANYYTDVVE